MLDNVNIVRVYYNILFIDNEFVTVTSTADTLRMNVVNSCLFKCATCDPTITSTCTRYNSFKIHIK